MTTIFDSILNSGSLPVLERVAAFTQERHQVLVDNITNFDTIGYKMKDLPVEEFQKALSQAIETRSQKGSGAPLEMSDSQNLKWGDDGSIQADPVEIRDNNILFHDENNRFVEKQMSDMMKNAMLHNVVNELLRSQYNGLETAIRGRL